MKKIILALFGVVLAFCLFMPISALEGSNASGDATQATVEDKQGILIQNGIKDVEITEDTVIEFVPTEPEVVPAEPEVIEDKAPGKTVSEIAIVVDVKAVVNNSEAGDISDLYGKVVTVSTTLNTEDSSKLKEGVQEGYERKYYVVREHNGEYYTLPATLEGDVLTFASDKFSTFTVVYEDVKKEVVEEEKEPTTPTISCAGSKDKNCDGVVTCDEEKGQGWEWNESKKVCEFKGTASNYYVVNTSTK